MSVLLPNGQLPGTIYVESEFQVPGAFATCGPNSLGMAESYGLQSYVSTGAIYTRMLNAKRCDPGGASNMSGIQAQAQADGFKVNRWSGGDWKAWTHARLLEGAPVIIEPSKGQVLRDLVTGQSMDAVNLEYHFNLAVGYWPGGGGSSWGEGFWMADGDSGATNPIVNGRRVRVTNGRNVQYYSAANLAASAPVALLAVYPKVSAAPTLPVMPPEYAPFLNDAEIKAQGWRYGTYKNEPALISRGGAPMYRGFALWAASHPQYFKGDYADNLPDGPEEFRGQVEAWNPVHGSGSVQTLTRLRLVWTAASGVYAMWTGSALDALEKKTGVAA
jgi:hypothetical protein